jgi:uncharacterized integral membrane protein
MRIALVLLLLFAAVIFAAQNATTVTITVLAWRLNASLAIVVAIAFAVGAFGGVLASVPRLYRMRIHEKRLRAQLADLGGDDEAVAKRGLAQSSTLAPPSRERL